MTQINISDALTKPLDVAQRNPGIIVPALLPAAASIIFVAIMIAMLGIPMGILGGMGPGMGPTGAMSPINMFNFGTFVVFFLVFFFVMVILNLIAEGAIVSMAYSELKGTRMNYMDGLNDAVAKIIPLIIASVIIAIGVTVGLILLVIPGLIFALLVIFAIQEVMIANKNGIGAVSNSIDIVKNNFGNVLVYAIVLLIVVAIISMALSIIPVVGTAIASLVLVPYASISITYAYMQIQGEEKEGEGGEREEGWGTTSTSS
ncbi:MAG: hypothetical protein R6U44_02800 [Archaeoglobaceae archaeon]